MISAIRIRVVFLVLALGLSPCYHPHPITQLPNIEAVKPRTLFVALDGVPYTLIKELKDEGHFKGFQEPMPFVSTFPSATTVGFTGILQPLNVGVVPGYEARFYSYQENRIEGGTPFDIYKIPINYKYYFDSFRHRMEEKAIMYTFPGMAGVQDLHNTEKILKSSQKNVLMTYLGGTDGMAHILGRDRSKRFLIYMDRYLEKMKARYEKETGQTLRLVLFSDHGFDYRSLKTIGLGEIKKELKKKGLNLSTHLRSQKDVVAVTFGLLTSGVLFTDAANREAVAQAVSGVEGIDLVFWHPNSNKVIHILNSKGERARFDYQGMRRYRYVAEKGDPLHYAALLKKKGYQAGQWLDEKTWFNISYDQDYPDAGYRLYDSFFNLVENKAGMMFSTFPAYQFGSVAAKVATWAKFGQRGTHGGLFRESSWGVVMTNDPRPQPKAMRYDELFGHYLPTVVQAMKKKQRPDPNKEVMVFVSPEQEKSSKENHP